MKQTLLKVKTCQYGGLTILGVEGYRRLKNMMRRGKTGE